MDKKKISKNAESSTKPKSILRKASTTHPTTAEQQEPRRRSFRFDEMNIIATFHPENKDYGFMKIDEAPTPFQISHQQTDSSKLDVDQVTEQLLKNPNVPKVHLRDTRSSSSDHEDICPLVEERRRSFLERRKQHYDEFKRAKELLAKGLSDDEEK